MSKHKSEDNKISAVKYYHNNENKKSRSKRKPINQLRSSLNKIIIYMLCNGTNLEYLFFDIYLYHFKSLPLNIPFLKNPLFLIIPIV
jgi:hypothetical protein